MGVIVRESKEETHYIFNGNGEKVPFEVNMLIEKDRKTKSREFELEFPESYISNDSDSSYYKEPMDIENLNVLAA